MESFGSYLKSQREKKGIRLEEIASITKINLKTLTLMEADKWDGLPPEPFISGFIAAYCKCIGLNPQEMIELYRTEIQKPVPSQSIKPSPEPVKIDTDLHPVGSNAEINKLNTFSYARFALAIGFLLVVSLILGLIYIGRKNVKTAKVEESKSEKTTIGHEIKSGREEKTTTTASSQAPEEEVPSYNHNISITSKERTWVKVVIDDNLPLQFFLPEGNTVSYKAKEKIKVVLGNSVGSKVIHNGVETEGQKLMGTIRYYIFPEGAKFPQDKPVRQMSNDSTEKSN